MTWSWISVDLMSDSTGPEWDELLWVDPEQEVNTWDRLKSKNLIRGAKVNPETEALNEEASNQTRRRETKMLENFFLLLYIHLHFLSLFLSLFFLFFYFFCKISRILPVDRKRAPAAAGDFLSRQVNFFAISSSPQQSDRRSVVSCFLFPVSSSSSSCWWWWSWF